MFLQRMKSQMELRIYFCNCYFMTQTDLPEDSKLPGVYFGAAIVTDDEYSSDEEEDDEGLYMWHQVELHNAKPQLDRVYAPPSNLLDIKYNEDRKVTFNIGEEIRYTNDGHNEKVHIITGNFSNEGMKYNLRLERGEDIFDNTTHIAHLDDPDIDSIPLTLSIFKKKYNIYQMRIMSAWCAQPNSQHFNSNF